MRPVTVILAVALTGLWMAIAAASAGPASATRLPPSNGPLPGSSFQGADGNQDDASSLLDWQTKQSAGMVDHSPDPNGDDSAFAGGSKENEPGDWALTAENGGVSPGKANILDSWSSVYQSGTDTFLYLGFTRQDAQGTSFLTFELNRDDRLWNNGRANIPCRRTGDILISYEANGSDVDVVIRRWRTTATDNATGCATRGELEDSTRFTPNVDVQGAINSAAITSRLPGSYTGTVGTEKFGEASLNLARVLEAAFGDDCLAFASVWMHSRSSTSNSANMQDYVAPRALSVRTCTASGTKFFDSNANGRRDDGELGIPRFQIWADYDNDGIRDSNEPFDVSDRQGQYVIFDIRGTYTLREKLLTRRSRTPPVAPDWVCSFPTNTAAGGRFPCAWGPTDGDAVPNATGRDFGNWFPARLTLEKVLRPAADPGVFDFLVDGEVKLAAAGDGVRTTLTLPPGTYDVSETARAGRISSTIARR